MKIFITFILIIIAFVLGICYGARYCYSVSYPYGDCGIKILSTKRWDMTTPSSHSVYYVDKKRNTSIAVIATSGITFYKKEGGKE